MYRTRLVTLFAATALFVTAAVVPLVAFRYTAYSSNLGHMHSQVSTSAPPGASYKKVDELGELPDYLLAMGTLYVDPRTLPMGPYLGYNHSGKLVSITYMVPADQLHSHKAFVSLRASAGRLPVDPMQLGYSPGDRGVEKSQ